MREVPEAGKPSYSFWLWLIACLVVFVGINTAAAMGHASRPLWIVMSAVAWFGIFLVTNLVCPRGFRTMLRTHWRNNICGYDRVWFLNKDGSVNDRVEPRWQRNALLNTDCNGDTTPHRYSIYERITGWGWRTFRIGEFDGTPHVTWRTDIKLHPVYMERRVLDALIASDGSCQGVQFSIDDLLFFLNMVNINSLDGGLACLISKVTSLEKLNAMKADLIGQRDVEIGLLKQELGQERDKHQQFVRDELEEKILLHAYKDNLAMVTASALSALSAIESVIAATTRLRTTKEGRALHDAVGVHLEGITRLVEQSRRLWDRGSSAAIAPPTDEDISKGKYPSFP